MRDELCLDVPDDRPRSNGHSTSGVTFSDGSKIAAVYDYTSESGELLLQVVRREPKRFLQRRPDPATPGSWLWNTVGLKPMVYRLSDVLEAVGQERPVCIVEGEKDVENLWAKLGIPATCNAG